MSLPKFNSLDDLTVLLAKQDQRIHDLELANAALVAEVKKRFVSKEDLTIKLYDEIPQSGLLSHSFLKRAFSVWGLHFVAQLIISLILGIIYFIIFVILLKKALLPWFL
jgi:hypothetical protein